MTPDKQCSVCESRTVDITKPNGLSCTYYGFFFHSDCSSMFAEVNSDGLNIIKKVCSPCPNCETSIKNLLLKVSKLDQRFVEFVTQTDRRFSKLSLAFSVNISRPAKGALIACLRLGMILLENGQC